MSRFGIAVDQARSPLRYPRRLTTAPHSGGAVVCRYVATGVTDRLLLPVARADMRMLKRIESLDADSFYFEIARTKNSRHVDAVMAVLTMLAVGRKTFSKGALLHYDQMLEAATRSAVSFASLSLE